MVINAYADEEGVAMLSKEKMQKLTGYKCKRQVRAGIIELYGAGLIEIMHMDRGGYSLANKYKILNYQRKKEAI